MDLIAPIVLILGGILALSTVIVAKRPDAQQFITALVPFQGIIGVGLLVLGVINISTAIRFAAAMSSIAPMTVAALVSVVGCSILLGFLFGMPLLGKFIPGNSPAEQKMAEISAKIGSFQIIIGMAGILASLVWLVVRLGIISKPF
jgi:hypothetical protein